MAILKEFHNIDHARKAYSEKQRELVLTMVNDFTKRIQAAILEPSYLVTEVTFDTLYQSDILDAALEAMKIERGFSYIKKKCEDNPNMHEVTFHGWSDK